MTNPLLQVLDLIESGRLRYLQRFITVSKFDLNQIGTDPGIAALHYASGLEDESKAIETCQLLIDLGAHVNISTRYDKVTPLHIAVERNFADLLELLLANGGDLEARNVEGDTPIALAIDNKNDVVIGKIVEHVQRKKQNSRLEALRASEALLTPTKRGKAPNPATLVNSPYYVQVKRKSTTIVIQEVIEISDESSEEEEESVTQYFTPCERASVNLFELTKENLEEFTKSNRVRTTQRRSLVSRWCDNIRRSDRPVTMIDNIKRLAKLFTGYEDDTTIQEEEELDEESESETEHALQEERVVTPATEEQTTTRSLRESEVLQGFIDLCVQDDEDGSNEDIAAAVASRGIPEIVITSPDKSMDTSIPREIRDQFPTSDLSRSPPEYQLWSDEEEQDMIDRAVQAAELPVIDLSESHAEEVESEEEDDENKENEASIVINESTFDESNFIKSPKPVDDDSIEQLVEEYEHRDVECGLKFLELKLVANNRYSSQSVNKIINMVGKETGKTPARSGSPNSTMSSIISTAISVPLDYDTDALRDELRNFGCTPGPITKSTKRLYLRRLFRYRKDPRRVKANQFDSAVQYFSLELQQTLKPNLKDNVIQEFAKLEQQMELSFRGENKTWRQGNAKKSFIYMLIDPRISQNLPGVASDMQPHEIWRQFLASVFYVGKGKSNRPYAHLYEAMEMSRTKEEPVPKKVKDKAKVERILDIWKCESGVVCLQVFHNIIPAEAFTREGAMIEALGVRSLTNLKSGEFYGAVQGWPQKKKKQLGIYLLFKALRMFLLEGESQISPVDL